MKNKRTFTLSRLIISFVMAVTGSVLILCAWIFTTLYTNALRSSAASSSEESLHQAANAIADYTSDTNQLMRRVILELERVENNEELGETLSTLVEMRDDLCNIAVYTEKGNLINCWSNKQARKERTGTLNIQGVDADTNGLYITPPHVLNLYKDYYPWVITVASPATLKRYGDKPVYVTLDLQFSSIAAYVDDVGIGTRGYTFLIDQSGRLIYHPQQQLIYVGIKQEDTLRYAGRGDGVYTEGNTLRIVRSIPQSKWRLVGVSYLDELVETPRNAALRMIAMVGSVALLLVLGVAAFAMGLVSAPIQRLVAQMHRFEQDATGFQYEPVRGTQEIAVLSDSFGHMVCRIQELIEEVKHDEETLQKTELKALQAQINPHFLYNTLDSIQWMCEVGRNTDAVQMVGALARLFRISISRGAELIPIRRELEHAESYLIIQKFRYKDQFQYRFVVDDSLLDCLCSKITLQPIIENAILHGFGEFVDAGEIVIEVKDDGQDIIMSVTDNGIGMEEDVCARLLSVQEDSASGIGIKNVNDRNQIYFGEQYGVSIESEPDEGTCVTIRLPKIWRDERASSI
ncbi:MAG: sensor histidine kinase [Butyricicoccus pullicaecorum]|nr:sensor histidine kinase [Butyricicoccus pullicaecorum]